MTAKRKNSRAKGCRGELQAAKYLASIGFPGARRTAQRCGKSGDASDVVVPDLPRVHLEVKNAESVRLGTKGLEDALLQAERDAGGTNKRPVVLWWETRKGWRLTWRDGSGRRQTTDNDTDIASALRGANAGELP